MRKILFWLHLSAGVTAGVVVMVMSITGVLLAYEKQCIAWLDRGHFRTPFVQPPLPLAELLRSHAQPGMSVILRSDPSEPVELVWQGSRYIDPHSAKWLGTSGAGPRAFFQKITAWHRYLGQDGPGRATAKLITGICNLAFLFLVLSGAFLWIPRKWSWQHLRPVVWFRRGLSGKARDFNWHNTLGLWCLVPLAVVVAGAAPISFGWAGDLVYRLAGSGPPMPAPPAKPMVPRTVYLAGLDSLVARAKSQHDGWTIISFRVPDSEQAPVAFTVDWGTGAQPQKRGTLTLQRDGSARWEDWDSFPAGRRWRQWLRFLHTGEALGYAGQGVAAIASGSAVVLGYTGLMLAWRRFQNWGKSRSRA